MKINSDPRWEERFRAEFGDEYAQFLMVKFNPPPRMCPVCQTATIREIWLGDAARILGGSLQGLWYLWCESCLRCIRSPLGACTVPEGSSYVQWSDGPGLLNAMPHGLRMIEPKEVPIPPASQNIPRTRSAIRDALSGTHQNSQRNKLPNQ